MPTPSTCSRLAPLLIVLAVVSTGCATQLPPSPPARPPQIPPPPAELMQPPASGSWSESVQQLYRKWLKLLTPATPA